MNRRCLSKDECHQLSAKLSTGYQRYRFKAFGGECDHQCPVGYEEDQNDSNKCVKCEHTCPKSNYSFFFTNIDNIYQLFIRYYCCCCCCYFYYYYHY